MGKRKNSTTTIMVMLFLLVFSLPALAVQALTTTQMRENSIRINALELTRKKAMDKLDFYERVVRSVAREENEVSDYYEIMGEKKQRSTVMLGTAPEEAPAEQQQVEQNAAPTEAQATPETKVEEAK